MSLRNLRREYRLKALTKKDLHPSPLAQFRHWFNEAVKAEVVEPNAMALATADVKPSCRMVLMKQFDDEGLVFYTDYSSRKARELEKNPWASALFFWKELERQIIVEGPVGKISTGQSAAYFSTRPRGSQLGAWASKQDSILPSREALEKEYERFDALYKGQAVPAPPSWGGFCLKPLRFEFWQGRDSRLHDRFCYRLEGGAWRIERLSP